MEIVKVIFMLVIGKMVNLMDLDFTFLKMERDLKVLLIKNLFTKYFNVK